MSRKKTSLSATSGGATPHASPLGTFIYFVLKADGTVLTSYGAGGTALDALLSAGWTALRESPLSTGGALLVLRR
jgi:hypothetical protein